MTRFIITLVLSICSFGNVFSQIKVKTDSEKDGLKGKVKNTYTYTISEDGLSSFGDRTYYNEKGMGTKYIALSSELDRLIGLNEDFTLSIKRCKHPTYNSPIKNPLL